MDKGEDVNSIVQQLPSSPNMRSPTELEVIKTKFIKTSYLNTPMALGGFHMEAGRRLFDLTIVFTLY